MDEVKAYGTCKNCKKKSTLHSVSVYSNDMYKPLSD